MEFLVWIAVIVFVIWAIRKYFRWQDANREKRVQAARAPDLAFWQQLGSNEAERERAINRLFDQKHEAIHFRSRYESTYTGETKGFRKLWVFFVLSRNIAAMDNREREMLRAVFLMYNSGQMSEHDWRRHWGALIYGDGKCAIENISWKLPPELPRESSSVMKYVAEAKDYSVEGTVTAVLNDIQKLGAQANPPAVIKTLLSRMRGGSAWLDAQDIAGSIFSDTGGRYRLRLGPLDGSDAELGYSGEGSLIAIAPPGSGKTQCFVLPNMLSWEGAAVVLDVKGEIFAASSKWRAKNVGPVYKFSPLDPANSGSYNPLTFVRDDPDFIWEDARFLADMLIVPSGASDPFWENSARDVLTAAIAYVASVNPPEQRPMSKVIDLMYGIDWDKMVTMLRTNILVNAMRRAGQTLTDMERKQRDSVLKTAQSSLSAWQGERIDRVTRKSDWNPADARAAKATIYICVNPNEIDSYLSVLRVFIAQHIRMLTSSLPAKDAPPVLFVLDELPRLKKMPPVDEALNIGRQYGIRLWMFAQSYGQLKESYPNAEGMLGSCAVRMFMNVPLNDELATRLSDQLGYREGPLDATRVKLVEPIELAGPNYRDLSIILATNTKPARVRKVFAYGDPVLQQRMTET